MNNKNVEKENLTITITKEDKELYNYLKNCENEQMMKYCLTNILELYQFCSGDFGISSGYLTPENYRDRKLINYKEEQLLKLKKEYEQKILLIASDFHPDTCECGVMRGPDTEWWFIDEESTLGFIALYANYIKMIDEVLKERCKEN